MAEELAKIHRIDVDALPFLPRPAAGTSAAASDVEKLRAELDRFGEPHPVLELALSWLAAHPPRGSELTFVHGDFRVGNLMVGPEGLVGVLDWEFARVGDPLEDVAWPLVRSWRFGADALEVGGVGERAPYLEAYAQASGRAVDPAHVGFWEIMGNVKWAVGSVELASLGRKTAEMELDLLDLLDAAPP
jgi:aminoglycoside phosphotransferase (APT) family kinase protein